MGRFTSYRFEYVLIAAVALISLLGFWDIYVGRRADPQAHHHLHVATLFIWMGMLLVQLRLIDTGSPRTHRKLGLAVLATAPLLVATTAMLSVHSAHRGLVSGEGDFLIVQNVMGTIWLACSLSAFVFKKAPEAARRLAAQYPAAVHGHCPFFALIAFAPPFRIEGPATFYRFQTAHSPASDHAGGWCPVLRSEHRNGWPSCSHPSPSRPETKDPPVPDRTGPDRPANATVGGMSQVLTFVGTFALLLGFLATTALPAARAAARPS
jgi:hypothetical protein